MRHFIVVKWKEGTDKEAQTEPVRELFEKTLSIPGVRAVRVSPCCIARSNRYDLMIEIDMEKDALPAYDESVPHKEWKSGYGDLIETKTIFDRED